MKSTDFVPSENQAWNVFIMATKMTSDAKFCCRKWLKLDFKNIEYHTQILDLYDCERIFQTETAHIMNPRGSYFLQPPEALCFN